MRRALGVCGCLVLLASALHAQTPAAADADPPFVEPAACDPAPSAPSALALYPPGMFGDFLVIAPVRTATPGGVAASLPVAFASSFKIAENESPRPLDRVFLTGNFYDNVDRAVLAPGPAPNVYREMIGFEKTFLGGDASVGVRLPYFQMAGDPRLSETRIGDVSVLLKYAFVNNRDTGNLASGGVVLTAPTGPGLPIAGQSTVNPMYVQPWLGSVWNWKALFVQNFVSLAVPTDARDATWFFKDISVGYWLYRSNDPNRFLTAIVPDAELHLNSPLNHHGSGSLPIGFPDVLDFTGGCYFYFRKALLGIAAGAPLTGPKPYDFQVLINLNYRF